MRQFVESWIRKLRIWSSQVVPAQGPSNSLFLHTPHVGGRSGTPVGKATAWVQDQWGVSLGVVEHTCLLQEILPIILHQSTLD